MADLLNKMPVRTDEPGDVVIGVQAGEVIGLDTAANTIKIDQTGSNNVVGIDGAANEVTIGSSGNTVQLDPDPSNNNVNIGEIGGTAPSTPGKIDIEGGNTTPVTVTMSGTLGSEQYDSQSTNLAGNLGTGTLTFTDVSTSTTGSLVRLVGFCQRHVRLTVQGTDTASGKEIVFGNDQGGGPINLELPENVLTQAGGTGKNFSVDAVNLNFFAGDLYLTAVWVES